MNHLDLRVRRFDARSYEEFPCHQPSTVENTKRLVQRIRCAECPGTKARDHRISVTSSATLQGALHPVHADFECGLVIAPRQKPDSSRSFNLDEFHCASLSWKTEFYPTRGGVRLFSPVPLTFSEESLHTVQVLPVACRCTESVGGVSSRTGTRCPKGQDNEPKR